MLSASKALACVHTVRLRETQKLCVGMCMCVSVKVLCVSFALLSIAPVSHKSVVFFVSVVFPSPIRLFSHAFALCCFCLTFIPSHVFPPFSCILNAAGQVTEYKPLQLSLLLRKTQAIAVSADIKVYGVFYRPCTFHDPEVQIPVLASYLSTITFLVK